MSAVLARPRHLIWFYEGRIVAYINRRGDQLSALSDRLRQFKHPSERAIAKLQSLRPDHLPLGQWLQAQGILQDHQLQVLFREQVIYPITQLLGHSQGQFCFQRQSRLPLTEMTGLSIPPMAVILTGLRHLQDWADWADRLPSAETTLDHTGYLPSALQLTPLEYEVWQAACPPQTLLNIALQLHQPLEEIQRIAFRLHQAGLLELPDRQEKVQPPPDRRKRPWLSQVFAQAIARVEGRSQPAEPLPPLASPAPSGKLFSGPETAVGPSLPEP